MLHKLAKVFEAHVAPKVLVHDIEFDPTAAVTATLNALHHQCWLNLLLIYVRQLRVVSLLDCPKLHESNIFRILIVILPLSFWLDRLRGFHQFSVTAPH